MFLICILLIGSVACTKEAVNKEEKKGIESNKSTGAITKEDGKVFTLPLEEAVDLSVFVRFGDEVDEFETNAYTTWLNKQTNINLEFVTVSKEDEEEKLNLLLATGSYPEVLLTSKLNYSQQALYGSQGIILPLNDLIDKYGERTKDVFKAYPLAKKLTTAADGKIYNLPLVNDAFHTKSSQKLWMYKPWLDEANLELPKTTEEFRHVLTEFADRGEDIIPLMGSTQGWKAYVYSFIMNAFVYYSHDQQGLYLENGQVVASYTQEGWKEGLKYLQQLRQEGLLATESFTIDRNGVKQIANNPDKVILGAFPYGYQQGIVSGATERWLDYVAVEPLQGPGGIQFTEYMPYRNDFLPGFSITNKCENPEAAMLLGDFLYSEESTMGSLLGRKDIEWKYSTEGTSINGKEAKFEMLIPKAKQEPNIRWGQIGNSYRSNDFRLGLKAKGEQDLEVILYNETADKYVAHRPGVEMIVPPLPFTEQQSAELIPYQSSIESYYKEKIAYFVLGDMEIDDEWDSYLEQLHQMGLDKMIEIYQESYDTSFGN